jgi:hypothetical protein
VLKEGSHQIYLFEFFTETIRVVHFFCMTEEIKLRRSSRTPKPSEKLRAALDTFRKFLSFTLNWNLKFNFDSFCNSYESNNLQDAPNQK